MRVCRVLIGLRASVRVVGFSSLSGYAHAVGDLASTCPVRTLHFNVYNCGGLERTVLHASLFI